MRDMFQVTVDGVPLAVTYHAPRVAEGHEGTEPMPALLVLNFGDICRSGPGDVCAQMGDQLSDLGYPVFRFDMPGLGDTPGDLPQWKSTYWRHIEEGGEIHWVCGLMHELRRRYRLRGFVLVGLCGGAVTSAFVALREPAAICGVILADTPYHLSTPARFDLNLSAPAGGTMSLRRRLRHAAYRAWVWGKTVPGLKALLNAFRRAKHKISERWVAPEPESWVSERNDKLLDSLRKVEQTFPTLWILSPAAERDLTRQDLMPTPERNRLKLLVIKNTNHLFTSGDGKERFNEAVRNWMLENFPVPSRIAAEVRSL
jgi:pimeloyl-ACP methyl ester carboxylesterase